MTFAVLVEQRAADDQIKACRDTVTPDRAVRLGREPTLPSPLRPPVAATSDARAVSNRHLQVAVLQPSGATARS